MQCEGTLLATGSYDGYARIWSTEGSHIMHQYINQGYLKAIKQPQSLIFVVVHAGMKLTIMAEKYDLSADVEYVFYFAIMATFIACLNHQSKHLTVLSLSLVNFLLVKL